MSSDSHGRALCPLPRNGYKGDSSIPNGTYIVLYTAVTCRSSGPMVYREWGGSTGRGAGEGCRGCLREAHEVGFSNAAVEPHAQSRVYN